MSNEIQLSQDLNVITAEINSYKQVAGQAIFEIGRRLKGVRDNLDEYGLIGYQDWEKWCNDTLNISRNYANKYIRVVEELGSMSNPNLGVESLYIIATLTSEDREKEHTLKSGETKKVDEMTVKELREVKQALKQAEEDKKKLSILLDEERNKPVKVETKVIEKEIDNTDYETISKLNKQIQQKNKEHELLMNEKKALENKMRLTEKENEEFQNLKKQIHNLMLEKEDISRQIQAATSISGLVVEVDHLIKEKLAPVKYSKAIQEIQNDDVVIRNLTQILDTVQSWCDEMNSYLPSTRKNIIDMEVL